MSESFASQFMTEEEKRVMLAHDPQAAQALHNGPRDGFAHNCYLGGLGMFFQKTVKNTIIEKLLKEAWDGCLRYKSAGNKKAFREARKNPEAVFVYDDPLLACLNSVLKESIVTHHTDNDAARKQQLLFWATDIGLTLLNEDKYYRARAKLHLKDIIDALADHPEWLELSPVESENIRRWNK